jgi:hypothetical protein
MLFSFLPPPSLIGHHIEAPSGKDGWQDEAQLMPVACLSQISLPSQPPSALFDFSPVHSFLMLSAASCSFILSSGFGSRWLLFYLFTMRWLTLSFAVLAVIRCNGVGL